MDLLILHIFGKDSPSVGLDVDCFQADETVVAQQRTQPPTSVLPADILSLCSVTDEKRNVTKDAVSLSLY
jgi:hypothetical protein